MESVRFTSGFGAAFAVLVPMALGEVLVPSEPSSFSAELEQDSLSGLPQKGVGAQIKCSPVRVVCELL